MADPVSEETEATNYEEWATWPQLQDEKGTLCYFCFFKSGNITYFKKKSALHLHISNYHQNAANTKCCSFCKQLFLNVSDLDLHIRRDHPEKGEHSLFFFLSFSFQ